MNGCFEKFVFCVVVVPVIIFIGIPDKNKVNAEPQFGGTVEELIECDCTNNWYVKVGDPHGGEYIKNNSTKIYDCEPLEVGEWILGMHKEEKENCEIRVEGVCVKIHEGEVIEYYGSSPNNCNSTATESDLSESEQQTSSVENSGETDTSDNQSVSPNSSDSNSKKGSNSESSDDNKEQTNNHTKTKDTNKTNNLTNGNLKKGVFSNENNNESGSNESILLNAMLSNSVNSGQNQTNENKNIVDNNLTKRKKTFNSVNYINSPLQTKIINNKQVTAGKFAVGTAIALLLGGIAGVFSLRAIIKFFKTIIK